MWEFSREKKIEKKPPNYFLRTLLNGKDVTKESNLAIYSFYGKEFVFITNASSSLFTWSII